MVLDENIEFFVIYITSFSLGLILIYLVTKAQIVFQFTIKVTILAKYFDFANIFIKKKTSILLK